MHTSHVTPFSIKHKYWNFSSYFFLYSCLNSNQPAQTIYFLPHHHNHSLTYLGFSKHHYGFSFPMDIFDGHVEPSFYLFCYSLRLLLSLFPLFLLVKSTLNCNSASCKKIPTCCLQYMWGFLGKRRIIS